MKTRTMRGKTLDMGALMAKNPTAKAVGNANMNARGDIINRRGKFLKSVNKFLWNITNPIHRMFALLVLKV